MALFYPDAAPFSCTKAVFFFTTEMPLFLLVGLESCTLLPLPPGCGNSMLTPTAGFEDFMFASPHRFEIFAFVSLLGFKDCVYFLHQGFKDSMMISTPSFDLILLQMLFFGFAPSFRFEDIVFALLSKFKDAMSQFCIKGCVPQPTCRKAWQKIFGASLDHQPFLGWGWGLSGGPWTLFCVWTTHYVYHNDAYCQVEKIIAKNSSINRLSFNFRLDLILFQYFCSCVQHNLNWGSCQAWNVYLVLCGCLLVGYGYCPSIQL